MGLVVLFFEMQTGDLMKVYSYWTVITSCAIGVRVLSGATFKILPESLMSEAAAFKKLCPFVQSYAKLIIILFYPWKVFRRT